jgi:hypothetical protein
LIYNAPVSNDEEDVDEVEVITEDKSSDDKPEESSKINTLFD